MGERGPTIEETMTQKGSAMTPIEDADPLCHLSVAELQTAYARRTLSPVEVARAALDRAETVQARFNAFTRIDRDAALAAAGAAEARWREGAPLSPIDGVPTTIKDVVWVAGWPIRYGSQSTGEEPCAADAPAVALLRGAGAVFLGLTTTPEFGWKALTDSAFSGVTRNPWNSAMTPGGSSGGAAVAAATGAGLLHLGTDGGGSIRVPASFTGIVGLKPTYGRVPAYPASAFGTVAHLGPMTRRVADATAMLRVMSGRMTQDWQQGAGALASLDPAAVSFKGLKIGFWSKPPCGTLDPEIATTVAAVLHLIEDAGAIVEAIDLPGDDLLSTFCVHWYAGAATRAAALSPAARARLDPGLQEIIAAGESISAIDYIKAMGVRAEFGRQMDGLLEIYDLVLSPTTAIPAFETGLEVPRNSGLRRWIEWAGFTFPINLSQQPAASVPCGRTGAGLPIGLQIIGARGADAKVLACSASVEQLLSTQVL